MAKQITQEEFINQSNIIHNNRYNYDKTEYIDKISKVIITCPEHGDFLQPARNHLNGRGCRLCARKLVGELTKNNSENYFNKCKIIHNNKYDYSKAKYISLRDNINIICPIHGDFLQLAVHHLHNKAGCMQCYKDKHEWTTNKFIVESNKKHYNFYTYEKTELINSRKKVIITCPEHGDFLQSPNHHLNGHGCKICKISKGERDIIQILKKYNINFKHEHKFENCKSLKNYPLRFDFYLPDYNMCIEFDGRQHFEESNHFGNESFLNTQQNDLIKNEYCKNNFVYLLRIKYDCKNIESEIINYINEKIQKN